MNASKYSPLVWSAPERASALHHTVSLPGSKSLTNRELVLAALATTPSTIVKPLHSRDTELMVSALEALGAEITAVAGAGLFGPDLLVKPIPQTRKPDLISIDCGLAGTVMRFIPPVAALMEGSIRVDGDPTARRRPMAQTIQALEQLGVTIEDEGRGKLPFTMFCPPVLGGDTVRIDASASSQFVSGLLLAAPRMPMGLTLIHTGESLPSLPHIEMTLHALARRGVTVENPSEGVWQVAQQDIAGVDGEIEPDLSNAAPFLAAPLIVGGRLTITGWPNQTTQVGAFLPELLEHFGAQITRSPGKVTIDGGVGWLKGAVISGVELDLGHAGELAPNLISLATLASGPSRFTGIGHLRGHETDRLGALVHNISALGGLARELPDGIEITPRPLDGGLWEAFEDHRMATSGALLGLGVRGIKVDNISCTSKTLPEFVELWSAMVESD
jgi:3-phosphoshikimate 1-carboxyvinyltransferase